MNSEIRVVAKTRKTKSPVDMRRFDSPTVWSVFLGKTLVGEIRREEGRFRYWPKGSEEGGELFERFDKCVASLQGD